MGWEQCLYGVVFCSFTIDFFLQSHSVVSFECFILVVSLVQLLFFDKFFDQSSLFASINFVYIAYFISERNFK